jgi:hypothetical protein
MVFTPFANGGADAFVILLYKEALRKLPTNYSISIA